MQERNVPSVTGSRWREAKVSPFFHVEDRFGVGGDTKTGHGKAAIWVNHPHVQGFAGGVAPVFIAVDAVEFCFFIWRDVVIDGAGGGTLQTGMRIVALGKGTVFGVRREGKAGNEFFGSLIHSGNPLCAVILR